MSSYENRLAVTAKPRDSYASTEFPFTNALSAHGSASRAASHREKLTID
jgi:hypothetical protein